MSDTIVPFLTIYNWKAFKKKWEYIFQFIPVQVDYLVEYILVLYHDLDEILLLLSSWMAITFIMELNILCYILKLRELVVRLAFLEQPNSNLQEIQSILHWPESNNIFSKHC